MTDAAVENLLNSDDSLPLSKPRLVVGRRFRELATRNEPWLLWKAAGF